MILMNKIPNENNCLFYKYFNTTITAETYILFYEYMTNNENDTNQNIKKLLIHYTSTDTDTGTCLKKHYEKYTEEKKSQYEKNLKDHGIESNAKTSFEDLLKKGV